MHDFSRRGQNQYEVSDISRVTDGQKVKKNEKTDIGQSLIRNPFPESGVQNTGGKAVLDARYALPHFHFVCHTSFFHW